MLIYPPGQNSRMKKILVITTALVLCTVLYTDSRLHSTCNTDRNADYHSRRNYN